MKYMVLYTDGSARPNPGISGYGIHGYIGEEGNFKTIDNKWVMTSVGYVNKKDKNRYVNITPDYIIEKYGRYEESTTNNQAELDALIEAIKIAKERLTKEDRLHIIADSEYVVRFVNSVLNNIKVDYNSNIPYLNKIKELMKDIEFQFTIERVDGHSGILGNEEADTLSNIGRNLKNTDMNKKHVYKELIIDPVEYWFYEPDINEFLKKNKKLLITLKNNTILNDKNLHCITNYKRKNIDEIGKKDPDINYAIIHTNKPVKEINLILEEAKDGTDLLKPYVIDLSEVLNKKTSRKLHLYGKDYIKKRRVIFDVIETTDSNPVVLAMEIFPESLSWYTVEHFKQLYEIKNLLEKNEVKYLDIKEEIYKNIKNNRFTIETDKFKIPLVFRVNIPEPSLFTKLKKEIKNIYLLYKEKDNIIYDTCIYIETENNEWMLETNFFSKIRFKKSKE